MHVDAVDEDALVEGILFDGSSIAGWKAINESDMILRPDLSSAVMDPFCNLPQLILFRSEEHTSELQSLMRISYAVFCLKKKKKCIIELHRIEQKLKTVQT